MNQHAETDEGHSIARHLSPDGVLELALARCYDGRDIHEIAEQSRARLRDRTSGALLLDLWALNRSARFQWTAGGIELTLSHPHILETTRVAVACAGGEWLGRVDGAAPAPLGEVQRRLLRLADPAMASPARPAQKPARGLGWWRDMAALAALLGFAAWLACEWLLRA